MNTIALLKNLGFGTELEYTSISRETAVEVVKNVVGGQRTGMEVRAPDGRIWRVVEDGSLAGSEIGQAAEIVTPILHYSDLNTLEAVVRALRKAGAQASPDTSQHVHVGVEQFSIRQIANLVRIFYKQEELILHAVGTRRERLSYYCRRTDPEFINRLETTRITTPEELDAVWFGAEEDRHSCRYRALNLNKLWESGTVEFRCFNGTVRPDQVRATVVLSLAIAARAFEAKDATSKRPRVYSDESGKYDMRVFLVSLGLIGDEFKPVRKTLLENLPGDSSRKNGRMRLQHV